MTQTFAASADAFVSSAKPKTNYGSGTRLEVDQSPVLTTYLRFAPTNLAGPVTRATLQLYARTSSNAGSDLRLVADNTWSEKSITYANAPTYSSSSSGSTAAVTAGSWVSVDVTPLITGSGPVSVALVTPSTTELDVDSRQGSKPPKLIVETTSGSDVTAPSAPADLAVTSSSASSLAFAWSPSTDDTASRATTSS